jgi:hypothetical protein
MPEQKWFLHIEGETMGPLSTQSVSTMLKQKRLEHYEFAWCDGLAAWTRLSEIPSFNSTLPPYPSVPPPSVETSAPQVQAPVMQAPAAAAETAKPAPISSSKAAPKQWPKIRRYTRVAADGTVEIEGHGSFEIVDLSEGGVFLHSDTPLALGTELKFRLVCSKFDKPFDMTGIVIREGISAGTKGFGVQFTRVNPAHKRAISELVGKSTEEQ